MTNVIENQFVIQQHNTPDGGHWDMMLQMKDTLWTWRLHHSPDHIHSTPIVVEKIADHPLRFLTYEGPVQNHTATVKILDHGTFTVIKQSDHDIEFEACGKILSGQFQLHLEQDDMWSLLRIG